MQKEPIVGAMHIIYLLASNIGLTTSNP